MFSTLEAVPLPPLLSVQLKPLIFGVHTPWSKYERFFPLEKAKSFKTRALRRFHLLHEVHILNERRSNEPVVRKCENLTNHVP